jgi:hypothetical protein
VWSNSGAIITDLGDGIELRVPIKMNTIGGDTSHQQSNRFI